MIEGGWSFVAAAYAVTFTGIGALALIAFLRARAWAKRARELEPRK